MEMTNFLSRKVRLSSTCLVLTVATLLASCNKTIDSVSTPAQATAQEEGVFPNGVNLQPSYYNGGNPNIGWSLMKQQSKIKTLRIELAPGSTSFANLKSYVTQAKANGYTNIICTYHNFGGSSNPNDLLTAANWWKANYNALGGGFTINMCNEWGAGTMSASAFASAYNSAIAVVRQVYSGSIVIDLPGYGHDANLMAQAVKMISDGNIILSNHIYPTGYSNSLNRTANTSDIDIMIATGKRCIIGEFGNAPSGSCDWKGMVNYAKSKGLTVIGWCWNGDGINGSNPSMNMESPGWNQNASSSTYTKSSYFNTIYDLL